MACLLSDSKASHCRLGDVAARCPAVAWASNASNRDHPKAGPGAVLPRFRKPAVLSELWPAFLQKSINAFTPIGVVQIANKVIAFTGQLLAQRI